MAKRKDSEIAKLVKKQRKISASGLSAQYNNTKACQSFYNGDQMSYNDSLDYEDTYGRSKQVTVKFNKVQAPVDAVVGFMAQNRRQAKFMARQAQSPQQALYTKNMNALYVYHREHMNADQIETDQDADMMICGYGAIETDLSYIVGNATTTPNGEILGISLDTESVYWDSAARSKNILDKKWCGYFDDYYLDDALDLFQDSVEEDFQKVGVTDDTDTGYVYNPWGGLYDKIKAEDSVDWCDAEKQKVRVYNHQWFEYETVYKAENPVYAMDNQEDAKMLLDRLQLIADDIEQYAADDNISTQDAFKFDPEARELFMDDDTKKAVVKELGTLIEPIAFKRKCYYTAVVSGSHVFKWFKSVSQSGFSIKFKTGIFSKQHKIWHGMVNSMMEPTEYSNKALTEYLFTIASNSKGGLLYEEDAVEDVAELEANYAKTNGMVKVAQGALSGGKIQPKASPALPTGLDVMMQLADASITSNGVDPAMVGQIDNEDQSGILFKRRIRQIQSKMARYFDSGTLYQREHARLCLDLIRVWVENNNGQWVQITGQDGAADFTQVLEGMLAPEYDISVQETPVSPEDKYETGIALKQWGDGIYQVNPTAGAAFYAEAINMFPLDSDVRNNLIQVLKPQQAPIDPAYVKQLEQTVQQLSSQQSQAEISKIMADADYSKARTMETMSNIKFANSKTAADTGKVKAETVLTAAEVHKTMAETAQANNANAQVQVRV